MTTDDNAINADTRVPVRVHSADMEWTASPSASVMRKRFFLRGAPESGQVTSLVKYLPGSHFPAHGHPDGEEILVLDGVFSDDSGDWPAGSWLLNPEGYRHAPSSEAGCLLFVKLRQYIGSERKAISVGALGWRGGPGGTGTILYRRPGATTRLAFTHPGETVTLENSRGVEGFVVDGAARVLGEPLGRHDWFRAPPGQNIVIESEGCSLYLDEDSAAKLDALASRVT